MLLTLLLLTLLGVYLLLGLLRSLDQQPILLLQLLHVLHHKRQLLGLGANLLLYLLVLAIARSYLRLLSLALFH